MKLKPAQVAAARKAVATTNTHRNTIEHLERIAEIYPPLQEVVNRIRAKANYAEKIGEAILAIHAEGEAS